MLLANFPINAECAKLAMRSVGPEGLTDDLLPAELLHYSFKFERGPGGNGACMRFVLQCNLFGGENMLSYFLRKAAGAGTDRIGIAACKGFKGIARRVDELARLLDLVSAHAPTTTIYYSCY